MRLFETQLKEHPLARVFLAAAPVAIVLSGCGSGTRPCRPTILRPRPAAAVDTGDLNSSSVIEARLTWRSKPVRGRAIEFVTQRRREIVRGEIEDAEVATVATGRDGRARFDLATQAPEERARNSFAESYTAAFRGDGLYCASSGSALFRAARARVWTTPQPVRAPRPLESVGIEIPPPPRAPATPLAGCVDQRSVPGVLEANLQVCVPG